MPSGTAVPAPAAPPHPLSIHKLLLEPPSTRAGRQSSWPEGSEHTWVCTPRTHATWGPGAASSTRVWVSGTKPSFTDRDWEEEQVLPRHGGS